MRSLGSTKADAIRWADIILALTGLIALAPLLGVIWFSLIMSDGAPALTRHARVGRDGRIFNQLAFRTVRLAGDLSVVSGHRPDRTFGAHATPRRLAGRYVELAGLSSAPSLWNVLRGDMSLVGPRPVNRLQLRLYGARSACYTHQRPGLVGLWTLQPGKISTRRLVAMDILLRRRRSLGVYAWILAENLRRQFIDAAE